MLFSFRCPKCAAELEADESAVGKFLDCPSCKESIQVLKPADAPPPAPPATPAQIPCAKAENLPHTPSLEQPFALTQFPWAKGKVSGQTKAEGQKPLQVVVTDIRLRFRSVFILVLYVYISIMLIALVLAALGLLILFILGIVLAGSIHAPPGLFR